MSEDRALFEALMAVLGDLNRAKTFIQKHPGCLSARSYAGETALHWVAIEDAPQEVVFLAQQGADVNAPDNSDKTPLHTVALLGHVAMTKLLLQLGANPRLLDNNDHSPLNLAAERAHPDVVRLLLAAGSSPDGESEQSQTPLASLLSRLWIPDKGEPSVWERATPEFRLQLESDPALLEQLNQNLPKKKNPADHLECLRLLLEAGADVNKQVYADCPVMWAAECAHLRPELLELVLQRRPRLDVVDEEGRNPGQLLHPSALDRFQSRLQPGQSGFH